MRVYECIRMATVAIAAAGCLSWAEPGSALSSAYTDYATFLADAAVLAGPMTTIDFESGTSGDLIADGGTFAGIKFDYPVLAGFGVSLAITDGSAFGGGGPFDALSGTNFLGTDDADLLQAGDEFDMNLVLAGSTAAIGLFVISADTPGVNILDGDLELSAGSITALLDVDAVYTTLSDGSGVYFMGLIDDSNPFTTASFTTAAGTPSGAFFYNIDDIVTIVPEPNTALLMTLGLVGLGLSGRARRAL